MIGAVLDRNGLRPGRYWVTSDGLVVLASEVGVLDIDPATVVRKGRLQPGRIFLADTVGGPDHRGRGGQVGAGRRAPVPGLAARRAAAPRRPAADRERTAWIPARPAALATRQQLFGYTEEELRVILAPMARTGGEPLGSMGTDTPVAVLSDRPRLIFDYFTQLFAQVTNPPLDAIREELVTSLASHHRPRARPASPGPGVLPPGRAAVSR